MKPGQWLVRVIYKLYRANLYGKHRGDFCVDLFSPLFLLKPDLAYTDFYVALLILGVECSDFVRILD